MISQNILKSKKEKENEIDLGLFLESAEENKIIYNKVPANIPIEDIEKLRNGFFMNGSFSLGDEEEIETKNFFRDNSGLANFMNKQLVKMLTILLHFVQEIFTGILEFLNE